MNDHTIQLEKDKHLLFSLIYIQKLLKLKMLKTYIQTNLANGFI